MPALASGRPPFRADHVGSLLRPAALLQAFKQRQNGSINEASFTEIQDRAIRDVLQLQESAGLKVVTDGEFRRRYFWSRFVERVEGFETRNAVYTFNDDAGHEYEFTAPYANRKIRRVQPLTVDEFEFTKVQTKLTPKVTLPAPSIMHFYRCSDFAEATAYAGAQSFFRDLGRVYQDEIADLANAGCAYVQLDEVAIALLCDPAMREKVKSVGQDPDQLVDLYIDAINDAVAKAPANVRIGVHMCRGNLKGHYLAAGSYESIAERFFSRAKINHFLLEFDTARAGDFSPLRFIPNGVGVVLGLVTSKSPQLENPDDLMRRVDEASKFIDLDRLAISPQCGFASTAAGNPLTESDEKAKLKLCADVANAIWRE